MHYKQLIKQIPFFYSINAKLKERNTLRNYNNSIKHYQKKARELGIVYRNEDINSLVKQRLGRRNIEIKPLREGELRIFYVGASVEQDFGGIVQGLKKFGDVIFFECEPERYGQIPETITKNRSINNGSRLVAQVKAALKTGAINVVIGQMWEETMNSSSLQTIGKMGIPVVNISMDDRHAFYGKKTNGQQTGVKGLIPYIDLACTSAHECVDWYAVEGAPAIYLPEASDLDLFTPSNSQKSHDVCFVGSKYGIRKKIVDAIEKRGVNVTCYGDGWTNGKIDVKDVPHLFSRSRIVLGIGTVGHCSDFFSLKMRDFDGPMSGSLYLTHHNPDLENLFTIGKEIETYKTPEECADKVVYYLKHRDKAEAIGKAGRKRAMEEHTWERRFTEIFITIGLLK